jgi:S-formylglutathione hydrolase FrmB
MLSRRRLLTGAAGLAGAGAVAVAVPGVRHRVDEALHPTPVPPHPLPSGPVGQRLTGSFFSDAMRHTVGWAIGYPGEVRAGLPVLLALHGKSRNHQAFFRALHYGACLSDVVRRGVPPFAVVSVDGGNYYWHERASGVDPQRMLLQELLPQLAARGLRTERFAVGGFSMGGYGALLLAETLGPARVVSVTPDSPALWRRYRNAAPGAFDDAADFEAHDVLAGLDRLGTIPVRVTCGTSDPFLPSTRLLLERLPTAARELAPGTHNDAWWQHVAPRQLAFAGRHLSLG